MLGAVGQILAKSTTGMACELAAGLNVFGPITDIAAFGRICGGRFAMLWEPPGTASESLSGKI